MWLSLLMVFPSLISLLICNISRQVPLNYLMLGIFTLGEALAVASLTAQLDPMSVNLAIALFLMLTVCLFLSSMVMKDSSKYALTMSAAILVGCIAQLILIPQMFTGNRRTILIVSLLGTLLYGAYVVIDLHLLANRISIDDYILGAVMLYIDLLRIFIFILRIVGRRK
jgi:protein lifeguard